MSTSARHALIVAVSNYTDPKLKKLRAASADADRLAAVLADPNIGDFEVDISQDEDEPQLTRKIARFFSNRRPDDMLIAHFSCHGVKDDGGRLYLAARDTEMELLEATGISANWLNEQIARTRSKRVLLLLDCCFSGSFPAGVHSRAGSDVNVQDHLHGRGHTIITASNSMEYSFEGDQLSGAGEPSFFTEAVLDALETGKADRDQDRWVSADELYDYVYDRVKDKSPSQTPTKMGSFEGSFLVARSSYEAPVEPAKLGDELLALSKNPIAEGRVAAVEHLAGLLTSRDKATALAARLVLQGMLDDDSRRVAARAQEALEADATSTLEQGRSETEHVANAPATKEQVSADVARGSSARIERDEQTRAWIALQQEPIYAVAFSPDGRFVVSGGGDGTARVWEAASGVEVAQTTHGDGAPVWAVAFSPDGRFVVSGGDDGTARVWEAASGVEVAETTHGAEASVRAVAFSPDGRFVISGGDDGTARVWEAASGMEITHVTHEYGVFAVDFSPNGRYVVSGGGDGSARIWVPTSGVEIGRTTHDGTVNAVAFSPSAGYMVSGGADATARVWEEASGGEIARMTHDGFAVLAVAFSVDGRDVVSGGTDGTARVWESASGREIARMTHGDDGDDPWVRAVACSQFARYVVSGGDDGTARLWESQSGKEAARVTHTNWVHAVAFSPDGAFVVSVDGMIRVWDIPEPRRALRN